MLGSFVTKAVEARMAIICFVNATLLNLQPKIEANGSLFNLWRKFELLYHQNLNILPFVNCHKYV
jgi:membrane protein YqaA with SNARE-associated domain